MLHGIWNPEIFTGKMIMLKNIIFILLALIAPGAAHTIFAAESPAEVAIPAEVMPASPADNEDVKEAAQGSFSQPAINTRPVNDNHVDYRYCLELKTDREIIECRYRKK
jgi:hypothetical protein